MRPAATVLLAGFFLIGWKPVSGQQLSSRFERWEPATTLARASAPTASQLAVPDSVRRIVGYQHWRGAGLGMAIGAGLGALLGALAPIRCSDCQPWSRGRTMWTVGLVGAGTGAVVGFLAGLASPKYVWVPTDGPFQAPQ